jgi:MFS family permease
MMRPEASRGDMTEIPDRSSIWRIANFRNLWLAQSVSLLGSQVTLLAFPLVALLLLHASALEVSLLATAEFLPAMLLGLPAGAWVERLPRRPILLICDGARALALASVPLAKVLHVLGLPLLYSVAFIIGLGTLFFDVAQFSYLPALVEESRLADGNAKLEGSRSFAQLAGPTVGGLLVQLLTAAVAVGANTATYLGSLGFLLSIRGQRGEPEHIERLGLRKEIADGLRFVFSHPLVRPLALCSGAADLAFAAVLALQVMYGSRTLHLSPAVIGIVLAVGNVGGLAGAILSGPVLKRIGVGRTVIGSIALFSIGAGMIPLATGAIGFGAGLFVVYLGVVTFNIQQVTICQVVSPTRLLGRMNATIRFLSWGSVPLGATAGGLLVSPLSLRGVLWASAGVCTASIIPPLMSPLRSLKGQPGGRLGVGPAVDGRPAEVTS